MNASKDNSCAYGAREGSNGIVIFSEFGRVKCRHSEGHRIMESAGCDYIAKGAIECIEWIEKEDVGKTQESPIFR